MAEQKKKKKEDTKKEKKAGKKHGFWLVILLLILVWWFNNYTLKTTKTEVFSDKINAPVRCAVISDLHATKLGIRNKTILLAIEKEKPDIVFILGDMYTSGSEWDLIQKPVELADELTSAGYLVYCITGEHDYDDRYKAELKKAGAKLLSYDEETIEVNGSRLHIMGIDNVYYSPTFDLNNEFATDDSCYNILLAHIPYYEKFAEFGAELTLCADTHGEMAQLPFGGGPVYSTEKDVWLPKLFNKELEIYDKGSFDYDGGEMFVTSGIGVYPVPVRFNNRPEVVIMDLKPKG